MSQNLLQMSVDHFDDGSSLVTPVIMTIAVVIGIAIFAILSFVVVSGGGDGGGGSGSGSGSGENLQQFQMENPVLIFREETQGVGGYDCSICLEKFEDGVEVRKMHCGHQFHSSCVDQWVASRRGHQSCPICRNPIV